MQKKAKGCRLGYCATKQSRYGGGGAKWLDQGKCPICHGPLEPKVR